MIRGNSCATLLPIALLALGSFAFAPHAQAAELLGHWALDETTQGSTVMDTGAGGNNGTPGGTGGGPSHSTDIPPVSFTDTGSYYFNGVNQYVQIASNFRSAMSVTFWFKPEANGSGGGNDEWYNGSGLFDAEISGVTEDFGVTWSANHVEFGVGNPDITIRSDALALDTWYQVSATWDSSTGLMNLYINGTLVATTTGSKLDRISTGVRFGELLSGANTPYQGYMDDIRTYDVALDSSQVQSVADGNAIAEPIVNSFSPADDATGVALSPGLAVTFGTTTVATSTGTIGLYKTADDSLVESFPASSSRITRSQDENSTAFTIDPSEPLADSTGYYVWIPNTIFEDGGGNIYTGTAASTTWDFTTGDFTPPVLSSVAASTTTATTTSITWATDKAASTKITYGVDTTYASSTSETDTSSRVTSHSVSLSGLLACTLYDYEVISADSSENYATSTSQSFTTTGCQGGASPSSSTSTPVTVASAATSTLADSGHTLTVSTPANFTATSSSVTIQIKGLPSDTVLDSIGKPSSSLSSAASIVFDVTALINNTTVLGSFDSPVTISYTYTDADVAGLDESSLKMYHYHDGAWLPLNDCSVDTDANTITCSTPSFSTFAIFGSPASSGSSVSHSSGGSIQSQVTNLIAMGNTARAAQLESQWYWLFPVAHAATGTSATTTLAVRDLETGMTGDDVRALQKILNANGFTLAATGPGAPGSETTMFGALTRAALAKFQGANGVLPSAGYFGPITRSKITALGLSGAWW